jgi:hypothetical protein
LLNAWQGSVATKTDTERLDVDSDPSKTRGEGEQKGSDYTADNDACMGNVIEGAQPNMDFYCDVTLQLEATNLYGVHFTALCCVVG